MNRFKLLFSVFLIIISISNAVNYSDRANLQIQILKYEPYPAALGQYLHVYFNVENTGLKDAEQVTFEIVPEFPFSLDESENTTRYFGKIDAVDNVNFDYKLRVSPDAVEGWNELKLRYSIGGNVWIEKTFDIYVQTSDSIISIENAKTTPSKVEPGKVGKLTLTLKNLADSDLRNIIVKLDLSSVPLSPVDGTDEKAIKILGNGDSIDVTFNLIVEPDASCGIYKLPVSISYSDYLGNSYEKSYYVTVVVGSEPRLELGVESSDVLKQGDSGTVIVDIANKGLIDVKFLTVIVNQTNDFKLLSPSNEFYIGSLDSDDYETFEIKLWAVGGNGKLEIPVTLEYLDENNNVYTESRVIELRLYSPSEIAKMNVRESSSLIYILIIVVIIVGYLAYKKWRRK